MRATDDTGITERARAWLDRELGDVPIERRRHQFHVSRELQHRLDREWPRVDPLAGAATVGDCR